jgi:hypothetical protein
VKVAAAGKSSDPLRHVNGHANGSPVDAKLLVSSARDAETIDVEPVSDEERFVTQSKKGRTEAGAKPPTKGAPNTP